MHKPPPQQILIHLHIYTSWPWLTLRLHWYHFSCQYYRYQYTTPWVYWSVLIPMLTLQIPIHYFLSIGQSDTNTDTTDLVTQGEIFLQSQASNNSRTEWTHTIQYHYHMSTLQSCSGVNGKALWVSAVDKTSNLHCKSHDDRYQQFK